MPSAIDFGELLHGVDAIEEWLAGAEANEAFRDQAHDGIKHCLNLMMEDIQHTRGTAAQELMHLLYGLAIDPAQFYPSHLPQMRAAIQALAVDHATCHEMDREDRRLQAKAASVEGNIEKQRAAQERHEDWQKRAERMWKLNPHKEKKEIARRIADEDDCSWQYVAKKIKKPD